MHTDIKSIIAEQIKNGEEVLEFNYEPDLLNHFIKDINNSLNDLGYRENYKISIQNGAVRIEIKKDSS